MKVVITGGHLSPALAVIEKLPEDTRIVFIGRKHTFEGDTAVSLEYQEITKRDIPFYTLKTGRLQRSLTKNTLPSLSRIPVGIFEASRILRKERPDCILSFGGYIGLPVVLAGAILRIPSVIHEQTLGAGFSNKLASRFARKVCVSWEQTKRFFPENKLVLTGNPLRESFLSVLDQKPKPYDKPMIYVTGGSAGSHQVNELIKQNLENLLEKYYLIHQTGDTKQFDDYALLSKKRDSLRDEFKNRYKLFKFTSSNEAAAFMHEASLVISRSGINTVTELLYLKKKSYLIPLLTGQKGEQLTNARFLHSLGLAEIFNTKKDFSDTIDMMSKKEYVLQKEFDMKLFTEAASRIVTTLRDVTDKT